jgi:hypothetical protein
MFEKNIFAEISGEIYAVNNPATTLRHLHLKRSGREYANDVTNNISTKLEGIKYKNSTSM